MTEQAKASKQIDRLINIFVTANDTAKNLHIHQTTLHRWKRLGVSDKNKFAIVGRLKEYRKDINKRIDKMITELS